MVLNILKSIGVNSTFFYQFIMFLLTYTVLHFVAFKSYVVAFTERQKKTVGDQGRAKSILEEVEQLNRDYQLEARKINDEISDIFNLQRERTQKEFNTKFNEAKNSVEKQKAESLESLTASVHLAKSELSNMTSEVASLIELKVNGGEQ